MSVQDTPGFIQYLANGATTIFPYPFKIFLNANLVVKLNGVTQSVGFTVSGAGSDAGGSVTFSVAPANGVLVGLFRVLPLVRETDYQQSGDFYQETVDNDQDYQTILIRDLDGRALKVPEAESYPGDIPSASERANKYLAFDSSGNPIVLPDTDGFLRSDLSSTAPGKGAALVSSIQYGVDSLGSNPPEKGFWLDIGAGANISRIRDRLFVGDGCDNGGQRNVLTSRTWVGLSAAGFLNYFDTGSQLQVAQSVGRIGISSGSRSSDQLDNTSVTIGIASYAKNDRADGTRKGAWAYYGHAVNQGITSSTFGIELDVCNISADPFTAITPYAMVQDSLTVTAWIGTGGETVQSGSAATQYTHAAIGIITSAGSDPKSKYDKGIVFQSSALNTDRGFMIAAEMPRESRLNWVYDGGGATCGYITSEGTTSDVRPGLVFINGGLDLRIGTGTGTQIHTFALGQNNVNGIRFSGADSGANPFIAARGAGTNLDLLLDGKGTGGGRLRDGASGERFRWNTTGLAFFGTTPVAKQTVTGSRGGNAALASLLTALSTNGLITDSSTA